ncbi:MAG: RNA polymerase sigma factor [Candidatus Hydrogenedentes bacterium]|jgi:RNA polymerase sigma-70 factor (ECF subfamily)|nr:RNA polymerase sigma factor [Candidatus Hydrogenedentota bacterium]
MKELSDGALALALQGGNEQAFEELVRRHQGRVFAIAYRITNNREDALDVTQEAFHKAYRKIDLWQPSGGFVAWLLRLTTNQAIDQLRRGKRHRHERLSDGGGQDDGPPLIEASSETTERDARGHEIGERVQHALSVLSPSQKTVFVLRHYEGMALAEIAPVLGCTVGSAKVHLFRALKKMRRELADFRD